MVGRRKRIGGAEEEKIRGKRDATGLGGADDRGLFGRRIIVVNDANGAEGGHGGGHGGLGNGVHRGGNAGSGEGEVTGEAGAEGNSIGREVDVVGQEDNVVIGIGVALVEEPDSGESVVDTVHGGNGNKMYGRWWIRDA